MGASTVAAEPDRLRRFTTETVAEDHRVHATAGTRLRAALDRLRSSRSEFLGSVPPFEADVARWSRAAANVDDEPAHVATALETADRPDGALGRLLVRTIGVLDELGAVRPWRPTDSIVDLSREDWARLVHGPTWDCLPGAGRYAGGGGIVGPDGLTYPLVVPKLVHRGETYEASAHAPGLPDPATLGGADPGWVRVGTRTGTMRHLPEPRGWERFFAFFAGTNPNLASRFTPATREVLESIVVGTDGYPRLAPRAPAPALTPSGPPTAPPDWDLPSLGVITVDGQPQLIDTRTLPELSRDVRRDATRAGVAPRPSVTRANAAMGGVDLLTAGLEGWNVAATLGDGGMSGYQVVFEVHEDGRRRALFRNYRVSVDGSTDTVMTAPSYAYLDGDGDLSYDAIRFLEGPTIRPAGPPDHVVVVNRSLPEAP